MSIRLMTLVWDIRWPTQNHLLVMLKLADHANDEGGKVWPAVSTIADQAQCSERTVQNVLKAFRECGLVSVVKAGGGSTPTLYSLNVELMRMLEGKTLEGCADKIEIPEEIYAQLGDFTGATVAPLPVAPVQTEGGGVQSFCTGGVQSFCTLTTKEPPIEPLTRSRAKVSNSDLGSEVAHKPTFVLTPKDASSWEAWMEFCRNAGKGDLAYDARQSGVIRTHSRYPKQGGPLPIVLKKGAA